MPPKKYLSESRVEQLIKLQQLIIDKFIFKEPDSCENLDQLNENQKV